MADQRMKSQDSNVADYTVADAGEITDGGIHLPQIRSADAGLLTADQLMHLLITYSG